MYSHWKCRALFRSVHVVLFLTGVAYADAVVYVDADATGEPHDGSSWCNAYLTLAEALSGTSSDIVIRVANGTYRPTPGTDRSVTFELMERVAIEGGFAGCGAPTPDERNIELYETTLSGDLDGDDGPDFANREDNSYHVVTGSYASPSAVLDGCTITGGYADVPVPSTDRFGAGMYIEDGSPTVTHCTFRGNATNASLGDGAGMYIKGGSPIIRHCTFVGNATLAWGSDGGGIFTDRTAGTISHCTFSGNSGESGGGIHNCGGTPTIIDCAFTGNSARYGGGMSNNYGEAWVVNCRFVGNSAGAVSGAIHNTYGDPKLVNCIFVGNTCDEGAGAIYGYLNAPTLTNCVFVGNASTLSPAGAIYNSRSSPLLTNCILWGNRGGYGTNAESQMYNAEGFTPSVPIINHSCLQGGWTGEGGVGNIDAHPRFVREPYDGGDGWGVGDNDDLGDLRLAASSPCIDAGDNNADTDQIADGIQPLPATDLDGNPRIVDDPIAPDAGTPPVVDMGAFEYQADCNGNTIIDSVDLADGTSADCNGNGVPDECEPPDDCNVNDIQDICDLAGGTSTDCNRNGVLDACDINAGTSSDTNVNGLPDECERDLGGYWQFDFQMDTGCYVIDRYLNERRYLRFDEGGALTESWIEVGGQYLKLNYPSTDGPSYNRYALDGMHTANTDRTITAIAFTPHAGVLHLLERVQVTDDDHDPVSEQGSEQGITVIDGDMDAAGLTLAGAWSFLGSERLCGPFTATKLAGPPPEWPTVIDLEAVALTLSTTDLTRPGMVQVTQRDYRVKSSFLSSPVELRYLLSADATSDEDDSVIGVEWIEPGEEGVLGVHGAAGPMLSIPECVPSAGEYSVLVVVDAGELVTETDESNNVAAVPVTIAPPPIPADLDGDCDGDLDDYAVFFDCMAGADAGTPPPSCPPRWFHRADLDGDNDVDLADLAEFAGAFTGS